MDNQDHKVEFLNELSEEFERDPDADGIEVRPTTFDDLLKSAQTILADATMEQRFSIFDLLVMAYKLGNDECLIAVDRIFGKGGAK